MTWVHKALLVLYILSGCASDALGQGVHPSKFFGSRDLGSGRDVWCIDQAQDGTVYMGTSSALVWYNGEEWESAFIPGERTIYSLKVDDSAGRIYVGAGGQFGYFDRADMSYHRLSDELDTTVSNFSTIWELVSTSHGIYFRSVFYIFRYYQGELSVIRSTGSASRPFDLIANVHDTLYTHIREVGLARIYDGQMELIDDIPFDYKTNAFLPHPDGLLIGTRYDGVFLFDGRSVKPFPTEADTLFKRHHIYQAIRLRDGRYALATLGAGLVILDSRGRLEHVISSENYRMGHETVRHAFEDSRHGLWLGLPTGAMYVDKSSPIHYYRFGVLEGYVDFTLFNGRLYFGTGQGVYSCREDGSDLQHVRGTANLCAQVFVCDQKVFASNFDLGITYQIQGKSAHQILDGTTWVMIKEGNRYVAKIHENVFHVNENWTVAKHLEEVPYNVIDMEAYPGGFVGVSISAGLFRYDNTQGYKSYSLKDARSVAIWQDKMVVTADGAFHQLDTATDTLQPFDEFNSLLPDRLSRPEDFLTNGDTTLLLYYEDNLLTGDVYLHNQLIHKLPVFDVSRGDRVVTKLQGGKLYIGGNENILRYDLGIKHKMDPLNATVYSPAFHNQSIRPYSTQRLRFDFSANQTNAFGKNSYRYKLEGYSNEWSPWGTQNYVEIMNLVEGSYKLVLEVKTPYRDHATAAISFKILPPWYRTAWAYGACALLAALFIWALVKWRLAYLVQARGKLESIIKERTEEISEQKATIEQVLQERERKSQELQKINEQKSRFFANISHELRTPLTLIQGQLEALRPKPKNELEMEDRVKKASRNTHQLAHMIDDLLDLSRLEQKALTIQPVPVDMVRFIHRTKASFESLADSRRVRLEIEENELAQTVALIDTRQFEKVISNLLYNAFKFTAPGGLVRVGISESEGRIMVQVFNTGPGIPESVMGKLFDRFYQAGLSADQVGLPDRQAGNQPDGIEGTGLGLAIAKEIVELHKGTITVANVARLSGRQVGGVAFTVAVPTTGEPLAETGQEPDEAFDTGGIINEKLAAAAPGKPLILVVEDNVEMQEYLEEVLSPYFQLEKAANGKEALDKLITLKPQLVLTDVMMPEMDGFELLEKLKKSASWFHIPMMFLTALASREEKLRGLRMGLDDYLVKPFDRDELVIRIANLIHNLGKRLALANEIEKEEPGEEINAKSITAEDEKLIQKAQAFIESNISDPGLSVKMVAESLSVSERQLYRRIASLVGMTPNELITEVKLQYARKLLVAGKVVKLGQLTYELGYSNDAYFSNLFFQRFGKRPGDYIS